MFITSVFADLSSYYYLIIWLIIIILSFYVEAISLNLISIWFTIGGIAALVTYALGAAPIIQFVVFLIVSLLLLLFTRPLVKNYLKVNIVHTNADKVLGKLAIVTKQIESGDRGEVRVEGRLWTAVGADANTYNVGEKVEVLTIEGVKLIVRKIENE